MPQQFYSEVLEKTVNRHAKFQPANGNIKTHAVCDTQNDDYMVVDSGWNEKGRRIYDVVIHFRLQNDKVSVKQDNTDAEVVRELIEDGIAKDDITLADNAVPFQKLDELIAV